MLLFGIGAVLPLGSVIWALLLSHGLRTRTEFRRQNLEKTVSEDSA
ncbi:MAG: hypothetical protein LBD06_06930 [Candidatus Accumulibacter sp.]|nr:hypothetical protein [Accumulibacter sp.]